MKESAETIKYYYSGSAVLFTTDPSNFKKSENIVTLGGEVISSKRFGDVQDGNAWYYFNYDLRGSTTVVLKPDGGYKKDYHYDTFGNTTEGGGSFYNETQFTGATYDKSTGLHYMNARYYNPSNGRFLTQDKYSGNPYDPWTQNLYAYAGNNPVNFVDPTGHFFNFIAAGIGGLIGAVVGVVANGVVNAIEGRDFFENAGAAALAGGITGAAAGLTCGASLVVTGAGMLATTGVTGAGAVAVAAGAYGASSMLGNAAGQAVSTGEVDPDQVIQAGVTGAVLGGGMQGISNIYATPQVNQSHLPRSNTKVHQSGKSHGDTVHNSQIQNQLSTTKNSGKYTDIYVNKGLRNVVNANKNYRPDLMGVRHNGKINVFEVQSKSQTPQLMQWKMDQLRSILGGRYGSGSRIIWRQ